MTENVYYVAMIQECYLFLFKVFAKMSNVGFPEKIFRFLV